MAKATVESNHPLLRNLYPDRRGMLAAIVASAAIGATSTLASGVPSATASACSDPIFAVIEAHKANMEAQDALCDRQAELEGTLPADLQRTKFIVGFPLVIVETDAPEWIALETDVQRVYGTHDEIVAALCACEATTIEGVVAVLAYVYEHELAGQEWFAEFDVPEEDLDRAFSSDRAIPFANMVCRNAARTLARLTRGERS